MAEHGPDSDCPDCNPPRQTAPDGEVGRCGAATPDLVGVAATGRCALPHGHRGWHRDDTGCEWTPTAPDGGEGIVGALAEALCVRCGHNVQDHLDSGCCWWTGDPRDVCPCALDLLTALAPTVARLIKDAVAARLAGVAAAIRDERRRDPSTYNVWSRIDSVLYAALHPEETR